LAVSPKHHLCAGSHMATDAPPAAPSHRPVSNAATASHRAQSAVPRPQGCSAMAPTLRSCPISRCDWFTVQAGTPRVSSGTRRAGPGTRHSWMGSSTMALSFSADPVGDGEQTVHAVEAADENEIPARLAADPWAAAGLLRIGTIEPWALRLDSRPDKPARKRPDRRVTYKAFRQGGLPSGAIVPAPGPDAEHAPQRTGQGSLPVSSRAALVEERSSRVRGAGWAAV
jgi:hypothetical protein